MGVKYPVLLGLPAFLSNCVPMIESFIAGIATVSLAVALLGPWSALIIASGYVAIIVAVSNVHEPRVMGRGLGLSPLIILVSMVFWCWVVGPIRDVAFSAVDYGRQGHYGARSRPAMDRVTSGGGAVATGGIAQRGGTAKPEMR
jgi:hypothetical protein